MWNYKLCMGAGAAFGVPVTEQIKVFAQTGFEAFFTGWKSGVDISPFVETAKEYGMIYQSIHAPFNKTDDMWSETEVELAQTAENELIECVELCSRYEIPVMVSHAIIGFDNHTPTQAGLERYGRVIAAAEKNGIKIAFENTEGEEYLAAILNNFSSSNVGFCWDSGHEMCYNHSQDMLALYGDRLFATHLNDNLGVRSYDGSITFLDDLHLLPFDGIGDWRYNAERLDRCGFNGIMTFELLKNSKPNRHENDGYENMSFEYYVTECYKRACRVAALRRK